MPEFGLNSEITFWGWGQTIVWTRSVWLTKSSITFQKMENGGHRYGTDQKSSNISQIALSSYLVSHVYYFTPFFVYPLSKAKMNIFPLVYYMSSLQLMYDNIWIFFFYEEDLEKLFKIRKRISNIENHTWAWIIVTNSASHPTSTQCRTCITKKPCSPNLNG